MRATGIDEIPHRALWVIGCCVLDLVRSKPSLNPTAVNRILLKYGPCLIASLLALSGCRPVERVPRDADLVFSSTRSGNSEIYLLAAGDTSWVNLTNHIAGDNWPEWSPDGSMILFQSNRNGALDLFVMAADGSGLKQVTSHPDHDYLASWTPDGRILFTSWRQEAEDTTRAPHLYLTDAEEGMERRLVLESGLPASNGRYSPDGQWLAFSRTLGAEPADIWIATADGTGEQQLTSTDSYDSDPVFSPDGKQIAYYADRAGNSAIRVMNSDGSEDRIVQEGGLHYYPRWSPDGQWLLSCWAGPDENYDVMVFPIDASKAPVTLAGGSTRECEGAWRPRMEPG